MAGNSHAVVYPVPYPNITAPVTHAGKYHILQAGGTYVMLDRTKGLSIALIGHAHSPKTVCNPSNGVVEEMSLHVTVDNNGQIYELDQINAPDAVFRVISQGPDYAAARIFFSLCADDGIPRGNGTIDMYVYPGRFFLVPSMFIEPETGGSFVTHADMYATVAGKRATLDINGKKVSGNLSKHVADFGDDQSGFSITVSSQDRPAFKMGWLRNHYPNWMYLNEIAGNPEIDDLYEKWPPWITQRHRPGRSDGSLTWIINEDSGFTAQETENGIKHVSFAWVKRYTGYHTFRQIYRL